MITGHGIDIVDIARIRTAMEKSVKFAKKVFTKREIDYCETKKNKYQSYAARFAAKEAFMKAIGTGWAKGITFTDIEITSNPDSVPEITLHNETKKYFDKLGYKNILISLSHTDNTAIASVIITSVNTNTVIASEAWQSNTEFGEES